MKTELRQILLSLFHREYRGTVEDAACEIEGLFQSKKFKRKQSLLHTLPANEANDEAESMAEALAEGATTKKALAKKYGVCVKTLNRFLKGEINPERL